MAEKKAVLFGFVVSVFLGVFSLSSGAFAQTGADCRILKTQWSEQDEKNYQDFVTSIGMAVESKKCHTVTACMKSAANPYRKTDPSNLQFENDCGRLSPALRAYFACKNGLPFSVVSRVVPRAVPGNNARDIRYNRFGNRVAARTDIITKSAGRYPSIVEVLNRTVWSSYFTASYRFYYKEADVHPYFADFYPTDISRDAIRPGTVIYDPNGHVVTVYRVEDDGRVRFIDSHPDNSLTAGTYGKQFVRTNAGQGAGFKYWRPLRLEGASRDSNGAYVGGKIIGASNASIPYFSTVQFFGTTPVPGEENWRKGTFEFDGRQLEYYSWVRARLAKGNLRLEPRAEMRNKVEEICEALRDRVYAVNTAIEKGFDRNAHPPRLPDNIYGTSGDWETYSTPSRDARLKVAFIDLLEQSASHLDMWRKKDSRLDYTGPNLAADLLDTYTKESQACQIAYKNSVGTAITLNLEEVRQRLFKLSFDPYHCVELRWGAVVKAAEVATCRLDQNKKLWYEREQFLRNSPDRTYDVIMNFSLDELATWRPGNGLREAPDVDIVSFLRKN